MWREICLIISSENKCNIYLQIMHWKTGQIKKRKNPQTFFSPLTSKPDHSSNNVISIFSGIDQGERAWENIQIILFA